MQAFSSLKVQTVKKQAAASNSRRRGTSPSIFFLTWPAIPELSGYRCRRGLQAKNKQVRKPLHSVKGQGNKATTERNKNKTATGRRHFCRKQSSSSLPKSRQSNLGSWTLWQRSSNSMSGDCGEERAAEEESRLAGSPNTSPENSFQPKFQFSHVIIYTPLKILSFFLEP